MVHLKVVLVELEDFEKVSSVWREEQVKSEGCAQEESSIYIYLGLRPILLFHPLKEKHE